MTGVTRGEGQKEEKKEKEKEEKKKENCCGQDDIEGSIRGPCGPKNSSLLKAGFRARRQHDLLTDCASR